MIKNLSETQKNIIRILFAEKESTRTLLSNRLSLTNAALTLSLKPLLEEKIILEKKNESQKIGRKQITLYLNGSYGCFLGIDIKKNHVTYSLMDFSGSLLFVQNKDEISLLDFMKKSPFEILSLGITLRGDASLSHFEKQEEKIYQEIQSMNLPFSLANNVDSLAEIYSLYHPNERNFLLIKYGPGVGSSIHANGYPLGNLSELGHMYYQEKTVEETISYSSILEDMNEKEATEYLLTHEEIQRKILHVLAFSLINADALLALNKIVLSGALLSDRDVLSRLIEEITKINPSFEEEKLSLYPDYATLNEKKSAIFAFLSMF